MSSWCPTLWSSVWSATEQGTRCDCVVFWWLSSNSFIHPFDCRWRSCKYRPQQIWFHWLWMGYKERFHRFCKTLPSVQIHAEYSKICRETLPTVRFAKSAPCDCLINICCHVALPSLHPGFSIPTFSDGGNHTREFAEQAATIEAHKQCLIMSIVLAAVGARVLTDDAFFAEVSCCSARIPWGCWFHLSFLGEENLSRRWGDQEIPSDKVGISSCISVMASLEQLVVRSFVRSHDGEYINSVASQSSRWSAEHNNLS